MNLNYLIIELQVIKIAFTNCVQIMADFKSLNNNLHNLQQRIYNVGLRIQSQHCILNEIQQKRVNIL